MLRRVALALSLWAASAWSVDSAHASGREHACDEESHPAGTTAKVRAHLRL